MADEVVSLIVSAEDKASGVFGKVADSLGGLGKAIGIASAAAAAMGAALFKVTKEGAEFQDVMIKAAQRANMGVKEFSGLAHAADLAGVGVDQLQATLSRMNRAISEASYGVREYKDEFDKLGISVTTTSGTLKTSDQVLADLADTIQKNGVNADVMAAGMAVAGRGFAQMLPLLRGGSAGFRAMAEDARYLGIEVGERAAKQAEFFNDSLRRLSQAFKGVAIAVSNETAPMLTGLIRLATDWVVSIRQSVADWSKSFINGAVMVYAYAEQIFGNLKKIFTLSFSGEDIARWVSGMIDSFAKVIKAAGVFVDSLGPLMISAFKLIWESFFEIGKWGWQKLFDFISGQNLADDLGTVLTQRIPEATAHIREQAKLDFEAMKSAGMDAATVLATHIGAAFGLSAEEAKKRADQITAELTRIGTVAQEQSAAQTATEENDYRKKLEVRLAYIQEKLSLVDQELLGETERIMLEDEVRLINLQLAYANKLVTEEQYNQMRQQQEMTAAGRLGNIWAAANANRERVAKMTFDSQMKYTADSLGFVTQLMNTENKKQFQVGKAAAIAQAIIQTYTAATNAYQSASAIPIVGWILGPIAAAAAVAFGLAQVSKIKSQQPPQAHAGLSNVPSDETYLLRAGERVLAPEQNKDLTSFLDQNRSGQVSGADGAQPIIQNISVHILENATNADVLLEMPRHEMEKLVADKIIPAFSSLGRIGIKPDYLEAYAT